MHTIDPVSSSVKSDRPLGRPPLRSPEKEREVIRACVKAAIGTGRMPDDATLGRQVALGERTVRTIRLRAGLNRWDVAAWSKERAVRETPAPAAEVLCWTPFAGLWLLVPLIVQSALLPAARLLRWTVKTGVAAWHWVLTVVLWAVLGFRRFSHLDDFRHRADLGLALFTGRVCLLADSTVGRLVHTFNRESLQAFYEQTAAAAVPVGASEREEWTSLDEHVVGFFTKLKPRPLGKTRVPTRGRSYPAIRLYAPFHLWAGRFVGLVVTAAKRALSQVVPQLVAELRQLRTQAGHPRPQQVDLVLDRGAYKGSLFAALVQDPHVRFLAMARATKGNVRQWLAVAEDQFTTYHPAGERNPNLRIADTETRIKGCPVPLRTVLIRDDTPETRQRWRAIFTSVPATELSPAQVDETYRRRQRHENGFAELDHYLAGKCLPKPYQLVREPNAQGEKRHTIGTTFSEQTVAGLRVVAWLRHWTFNLLHDLGQTLGPPYAQMRVGTLVRRFIARPGVLRLRDRELWVTLAPFTGCGALDSWIQQLNQQSVAIPWLGHLILQVEIALLPVGLAANPRKVRQRVFANYQVSGGP